MAVRDALRIGLAIAASFPTAALAHGSANGAWWPITEMTGGRNLYGDAAVLPDGRIVVTGGSTEFGTGGTELKSVEILNPTTETWTAARDMSTVRCWHTATVLGNGTVLVAGGNATTLSSTEIYDPAADNWSNGPAMSAARWKHTATLLPDGRVLVVGGSTGSTALASAEIYDPAGGGSWSPAGTMATARQDHSAVLLGDGRVLVVGGADGADSVAYATAEVWDPTANGGAGGFSTAGTMVAGRSMTTATLLGDGRVLVAGGGLANSFYVTETEIWDPATNGFTTVRGTLPFGRSWPIATRLADGRVLLAGGFNHVEPGSVASHFANAEVFDPATGLWTVTGSLSFARDWCYSYLLPDGRVLIIGGDDGGATVGNLRSAEVWNPLSGLFRPFAFARVDTTTPEVRLVTSDAQGDDIRYEVQWSTDPAFGTASTANSGTTTFTNLVDGTDVDPFTSQHQVAYTLPALTDGATYWWRARFVDPNGANRQSNWTASRSFTVASGATDVPWLSTTTAQLRRGSHASTVAGSDKIVLAQVPYDTGATSPSSNSGSWGTPNDAHADGGSAATTSTDGAQHVFGGYGITLPAEATITGIVVATDGWKSGAGGDNARFGFELSNDNGSTWSITTEETLNLPATEETQTEGTSSSLWGLAWTPANIGNLAVRITARVQNGSPGFNLDWIRVIVHYTDHAASGTYVSPILRNSSLALTNGRNWASVVWGRVLPGTCEPVNGCNVTLDLLDRTGTAISGYTGLTASPVDITGIDPATYPAIQLRLNFSANSPSPEVTDISVETTGGSPLSAAIGGLEARRLAQGGAQVRWSAEPSAGAISFDVLRAGAPEGPFLPIAASPVLVSGDASAFSDYEVRDEPTDAALLFYALDAHLADGTVLRIGPVEAVASAPTRSGWACRASAPGNVPMSLLAALALSVGWTMRRRSAVR